MEIRYGTEIYSGDKFIGHAVSVAESDVGIVGVTGDDGPNGYQEPRAVPAANAQKKTRNQRRLAKKNGIKF